MSQFSNGLARPVGPEQGEHAAARDLQVDAREGLDAVSMGRVAAELKAAPMSLYRRVSSKEELIRLMMDAAWEDSPGPLLSGENWRAGLSR